MAPRSCREGTRMLKLAAALLSFLALAAAALAEPASLSFGGGRLVEKYARSGPQAAIIEFVPPDQTLDSWTSLVGFRGLWESKGTAADAAAALALVTGERYPASKPRILAKGAEAMVVFVAAPPNDDLVEFNVFKYGRAPERDRVVPVRPPFPRARPGGCPSPRPALGQRGGDIRFEHRARGASGAVAAVAGAAARIERRHEKAPGKSRGLASRCNEEQLSARPSPGRPPRRRPAPRRPASRPARARPR